MPPNSRNYANRPMMTSKVAYASRLIKAESVSGWQRRIAQSAGRRIAIVRKIIESEELKEFDPRIWLEAIEKVTVYHDKRVVFTFQDGREITSQVEDAT